MNAALILAAEMLLASVLSFSLMGIDKRRAKRQEWRISEKTLFWIAILGGGVGGTLGMFYFRHKTKHWYFRYGFPLLAVLQLIGLFCLLFYGQQ